MKRLLATAITLLLLILFSRDAAALDRIVEVLAVGVTDNAGAVLTSGTVTVYDAGTTNLRTIYTDFALTSPASNPLTLDAAGRAVVYTDKRVKLLIKDRYGSTVRTIDNVGTADTDLGVATASALAGNGLTAPGDGTLSVNVDNVSTSFSSSKLRVNPGYTGAGEFTNGTITATAAASALTIALKDKSGNDPSATSPISISFRSSTLTSGVYVTRTVTAALSTVISSGSTAGHTNGVAWPLNVYAIDNAGTVELAWSTGLVDERALQSTTAEGGAGAADSNNVIYSTTARTSVAVRLVGMMISNQATAGTWVSLPTQIQNTATPSPIATAVVRPSTTSTVGVGGVAISSSSSTFTSSSISLVDVTNLSVTLSTTGRPVRLELQPDGSGSDAVLGVFSTSLATAYATVAFLQGASVLARESFGVTPSASAGGYQVVVPCSAAHFTALGLAAGTYTFKVQALTNSSSNTISVTRVKLIAYEMTSWAGALTLLLSMFSAGIFSRTFRRGRSRGVALLR